MSNKVANPDLALARIAARQHGVVSARQLASVGISRSAASRRARTGRLHRLHQGVYAVGCPPLSIETRWMAATLACGASAALSHLSAAQLWGLLEPRRGPIDISVPGNGGRARRQGIRVHRRAPADEWVTTARRGIPVTTPARTIADLKGVVAPAQLRRAVRQAEVLGLRTGLKERRAPTRSELEEVFLRLCRRHRLPPPEVNVRVGGREVDFLWRRRRLIVETDGYRYHRGAQAFEDDRERDLDLRALGYDVRRFSYRQVTEGPARVAAAIRQALANG